MLDGSSPESLGLPGSDLSLDLGNNHVYYGNTHPSYQILRSDLDGNNLTSILLLSEPALGVAVDPVGGHLYWTEYNAGNIRRADLDGSNPVTLASGLDSPRDIIFVSSGVRAPSTIILLLVGGVALAIPRTRAVSGTAPATPPSQWGSPTAHGST